MLVVAEILRHGEGRMPHAETAAGGLVHLTENHRHVRQHPGRFHVAVEFFAFAAALTDAAKNADAVLLLGHIVNHLS